MDVDDLRGLFLFEGLTDEQLEHLLAVGEEVRFVPGQELLHEGAPAEAWWMLVDGQVELVRKAGREEAVVMMTMDRPGVWAGGFRAWDSESSYLATARGASTGRMLRVPAAALREFVHRWFPFGVFLMEGFFQTVRRMDTLSRQRESLHALGEQAARFMHEINNPNSATARSVDALHEACDTLLVSLGRMAAAALLAEQFTAIDVLRRELERAASPGDPAAVADREEELTEWLDDHDIESSWRIAPPLAAAGADPAWCERVAAVLDTGDTLEPGLEWLAATASVQALLGEMKDSTARIAALVDAMKSYRQVDRASWQSVDVTDGIESTLTMLGLDDEITVVRDYEADVPEIDADAASLNQVWANLITNARDAMDGRGTLRIATRADGADLVVAIADSGSGMTPEVQARAFEPFYTTKDVGKGTGLGLDIARRIIVDRHHGSISIESEPGNTVLTVRLPRPPRDS
jgi:signal transduction histidine kinase